MRRGSLPGYAQAAWIFWGAVLVEYMVHMVLTGSSSSFMNSLKVHQTKSLVNPGLTELLALIE